MHRALIHAVVSKYHVPAGILDQAQSNSIFNPTSAGRLPTYHYKDDLFDHFIFENYLKVFQAYARNRLILVNLQVFEKPTKHKLDLIIGKMMDASLANCVFVS